MADTVAHVDLPPETWVDAYAETGIPVGTPLIINTITTKTKVYAALGAAEPSNPSPAVVPIPGQESGLSAIVTAGENGCWLRSTSRSNVSVQNGTV